jgi:hypothetical protein
MKSTLNRQAYSWQFHIVFTDNNVIILPVLDFLIFIRGK